MQRADGPLDGTEDEFFDLEIEELESRVAFVNYIEGGGGCWGSSSCGESCGAPTWT